MDKIVIEGGRRLSGEVDAGGAKNAALPLLFATLLTDEPCHFTGVPDVADIRTTAKLLQRLGAKVERPAADEIIVDASTVVHHEAPYDLVRTMRASFLALGPLLARFGKARVSTPGGCAIGTRPVDIHIAGLTRLGARLEQVHGYVEGKARRLTGGHAILSAASVGATENLLMAASLAEGSTCIENAAREPEIVELAEVLTKMGASISGAGSSVIHIEGVERLGGLKHRVLPDRIVAGTYLLAGVITRGDVLVRGARPTDLESLLEQMEAIGCTLELAADSVRVVATGRPAAVSLRTAPHPGFPTDLQAQLMAVLTLAEGRSEIYETIFENRFMHVPELVRMGASVAVNGSRAVIDGRPSLSGAPVMATDLRASVCLVLAGLAAIGRTEVLRIYHLDRGYERIEEKLRGLGAVIQREPVT